MNKNEVLSAIKAIGQYETKTLLRDPSWGEPIINAAIACAKKDRNFTIRVGQEDFSDSEEILQDLFYQAAEKGVYDLAIFDKSSGQVVLCHWYTPTASPDGDSGQTDGEYQDEVITVSLADTAYDPDSIEDPVALAEELALVADFLKQIRCGTSTLEFLENPEINGKRDPSIEICLWRR